MLRISYEMREMNIWYILVRILEMRMQWDVYGVASRLIQFKKKKTIDAKAARSFCTAAEIAIVS